MDERDDSGETPATTDIGERRRTWRKFLVTIRWALAMATAVLIALATFCTHR